MPKLASSSGREKLLELVRSVGKSYLPKLASKSREKTFRGRSEVVKKFTCQNWQVTPERKPTGADQKRWKKYLPKLASRFRREILPELIGSTGESNLQKLASKPCWTEQRHLRRKAIKIACHNRKPFARPGWCTGEGRNRAESKQENSTCQTWQVI